MPQVLRVQVTLNESADNRDHIINTWHCVTVGATSVVDCATAFVAALQTFYAGVDQYLANELNTYIPRVRVWDYSEPKPRQPVYEVNLSALATGTGNLPREVACCLSYKGFYVSGISPKSKRGRIYLGPLYNAALDSSDGSLASAMVSGIASAADTLVTASKAAAEYRWVIYSPTLDPNGNGNDAACWDAVQEGWVDDNPDIQRRRSFAGGSRTTFS